MSRRESLSRASMRRDANFYYMLAGLLITLIAGPIALELGIQRPGATMQTAFSVTLIVSIWSAIDSRPWFFTGIALAVITGLATIGSYGLEETPVTDAIGLSGMLAFCILSLSFVITRLFQRTKDALITPNRLVGALSVYLLLGIGFGVLNMLVEQFLPGSYRGLDIDMEGRVGIDLIYFSFVTMTTLGYGDLTPVRPLAQAVAYMGAIIGQFYIAVLVAGLVGAYVSQGLTAGKEQ